VAIEHERHLAIEKPGSSPGFLTTLSVFSRSGATAYKSPNPAPSRSLSRDRRRLKSWRSSR